MFNSQPSQSTNKTEQTKTTKGQGKQQKILEGFIAVAFVRQAALIGVRDNLDVLSGKSPLDVIPWMSAQGIELILKAKRAEKSQRKRSQLRLTPTNNPRTTRG